MKIKTILFNIGMVSSLIFGILACGEAEEDDKEKTDDPTVQPGGTGGRDDSSFSKAALEVSSNISVVQNNMVPGSLALSTTAGLSLQEDQDPCENADGFFDCQPELLKLYMNLSKEMVGNINDMVTGVSEGLFTNIEIPEEKTCDSLEINDDEELAKVDYCVSSKNDYEVLLHSTTGKAMHLSVKDNVYSIKADLVHLEGGGETAKIEAKVEFTDADNYSINVMMDEMGCEPEDVRAPRTINLNIAKVEGVWQGKAMLYLPVWLYQENQGVTCDTESTDELAIAIYTDFVGDDDQTSASLYMMPRTISNVDDFTNYYAHQFCDNNPNACNQGYGFGDANPIATYQSPFCIANQDATWGGACEDDNTLISTPTYSDAALWVVPSALKEYSISLPDTLE